MTSLQDLVARATVTAKKGMRKLRTLQLHMLAQDVRDDVEHCEPYGFTSEPHPGAEAVAVSLGGDREHTLAVTVFDRRYRPTGLSDGEVVVYDSLGRKIYLARSGIRVEGVSSPIVATTTSTITLKAAKVIIDGEVETTKGVKVGKDIQATGEIKDRGGSYSMSGMRATYNSHVHGDSTTPNPQM